MVALLMGPGRSGRNVDKWSEYQGQWGKDSSVLSMKGYAASADADTFSHPSMLLGSCSLYIHSESTSALPPLMASARSPSPPLCLALFDLISFAHGFAQASSRDPAHAHTDVLLGGADRSKQVVRPTLPIYQGLQTVLHTSMFIHLPSLVSHISNIALSSSYIIYL